jgi:hypothetical protein
MGQKITKIDSVAHHPVARGRNGRAGASVAEKAAAATLMLSLLGQCAPPEPIGEDAAASPPGHRLQRALERLREHPGTALPVEAAASLCGLSPAYVSRLFRRCHRMPFREYVRVHRLQLAAQRRATNARACRKSLTPSASPVRLISRLGSVSGSA